MQKEFGERRNYNEIQRRIQEHILIADSGYFSTENLHYLFVNKINALVMPKKLSEAHNNKLRQTKIILSKKENTHLKRILKELKTGISVQMDVL